MTHGELVFDRCRALVKDFDDRCERGRNGMMPSPSQTAIRAILKALDGQRESLVGAPPQPIYRDGE